MDSPSIKNKDSFVKNFSLEVVKEGTDDVIGTSDSDLYNTTGEKTFSINGLEPNKDYGSVEVTIAGNHKVRSNKFNLKTIKEDISELSDFAISGEVGGRSVNVTVNAKTPSSTFTSNEEVNDYSLELIDDSGQQISGSSIEEGLNTEGIQSFQITGLTPGTDYGMVKLRKIMMK